MFYDEFDFGEMDPNSAIEQVLNMDDKKKKVVYVELVKMMSVDGGATMSQAMTLDNILTLCEMPESVINMSPEDRSGLLGLYASFFMLQLLNIPALLLILCLIIRSISTLPGLDDIVQVQKESPGTK